MKRAANNNKINMVNMQTVTRIITLVSRAKKKIFHSPTVKINYAFNFPTLMSDKERGRGKERGETVPHGQCKMFIPLPTSALFIQNIAGN